MGIGDWGLGIEPNPKSPIPINIFNNFMFKDKIYFISIKKLKIQKKLI